MKYTLLPDNFRKITFLIMETKSQLQQKNAKEQLSKLRLVFIFLMLEKFNFPALTLLLPCSFLTKLTLGSKQFCAATACFLICK